MSVAVVAAWDIHIRNKETADPTYEASSNTAV